MKIIILGAGQVGASLAESLVAEEHDITVVDSTEERLNILQSKFDLRVVHGRCSYPNVLRQAGADNADMVIAVTDSDEANMIACQVAYSLFNVPKKIARIRSPHYFIRKDLFDKDHVPIDVFISPEQLITKSIGLSLSYPGALQVLDFAKSAVKMIAVKPYYGGVLVGKRLSEIPTYLPDVSLQVVAIYRNDATVPLNGETEIEIGDEVFFVTATKYVEEVINAFRRSEPPYKRIMIAGGGHIGSTLARAIEGEFQVKLIEQDRRRCDVLAEKLGQTTVLHGEATDKNLLESENIEYTDVFVTMTNDDEANIIAGLQAKRLGVRQVMVLITRTAYVDLIEGGSINIAISPQQATVGSILTHIRKADIISVYSLRRGAAEVIEGIAHGDKSTSRLVGRQLSEVKLPSDTIWGAVVRGGEVMLPVSDPLVEEGDHVIVFVSNKKRIHDIERLFQVSATYF